jgi:hypothetical protein
MKMNDRQEKLCWKSKTKTTKKVFLTSGTMSQELIDAERQRERIVKVIKMNKLAHSPINEQTPVG